MWTRPDRAQRILGTAGAIAAFALASTFAPCAATHGADTNRALAEMALARAKRLQNAGRYEGVSLLHTRDVLDWPGLCTKLSNEGEGLPSPSRRLWGFLSPAIRKAIQDGRQPKGLADAQKSRITIALNRIVKRPDLYRKSDFHSVRLGVEIRDLLKRDPGRLPDDAVRRLNRLLLEAAYPKLIAESRTALDEARDALRLAEDLVEAHHVYQDLMGDVGREAETKKEYAARLSRDRQSAVAHYLCARLETDLAKKEAMLRQALKLQPQSVHPYCHTALGFLYDRQRKNDQSEAQFKAALAQQPDSADALNGLGFLYMNMGKNEAATQHLIKAAKADPTSVDAWLNLGRVYTRTQDYAKAIAANKAVLKIDPENPWAQNNLGICYYRQARLSEAERCYREALRSKRYDTPELAHLNLAFVYRRRHMYVLAATHYQKAVEKKPTFAYAYSQLAQVQYHMKKYDEAYKSVKKAQELGLEPNPKFLEELKKVRPGGG